MQNKLTKNGKDSAISFRLAKASIESFSMNIPNRKLLLSRVSFNIDMKLIPNAKIGTIELRLRVKMFGDKLKSEILMEVEGSNIFALKDFKKLTKVEGKSVTIPRTLIANLLGISISNMRGIMIAKSEGTPLADAILPIVSPMMLLDKKSQEVGRPKAK